VSPVFAHGRLRLYLLGLLGESPRHGYDVIRLLEDRFMGLYSPSAGTIYPRLARLEREGLVTHDEDEGRKVYRLTDAGRRELAEHADELAALEREIAGSVREITGAVRELAQEVAADVRSDVRTLREELKAAARDVRRQDRSAARPPRGAGRDDDGPGVTARTVEVALDRLRAEGRAHARRTGRTAEQLSAALDVVERTRTALREALGG
jgi:DNA-binding PadR family transcriptional regulator